MKTDYVISQRLVSNSSSRSRQKAVLQSAESSLPVVSWTVGQYPRGWIAARSGLLTMRYIGDTDWNFNNTSCRLRPIYQPFIVQICLSRNDAVDYLVSWRDLLSRQPWDYNIL